MGPSYVKTSGLAERLRESQKEGAADDELPTLVCRLQPIPGRTTELHTHRAGSRAWPRVAAGGQDNGAAAVLPKDRETKCGT